MNASNALSAASIGLLLGSMCGMYLAGVRGHVEPLAPVAPHVARVDEPRARLPGTEIILPAVTITAPSLPRASAPRHVPRTLWVCDPPRPLRSGATQATPHDGAPNYDPLHLDPSLGNVTECHTVRI